MPGFSKDKLKVLPGKGHTYLEKREKAFFLIVLVLLGFLLFQLAYSWLGPWIVAKRLKVFEAGTGVIENPVTVEGMITRREWVVKSPVEGVLLERFSPGQRIPVGGRAAVFDLATGDYGQEETDSKTVWSRIKDWTYEQFDTGSENGEPLDTGGLLSSTEESLYYLTSPFSGVVSYHLDGHEHIAPFHFPYRYMVNGPGKGINVHEVIENTLIREGEPVFKVVDNLEWYFSVVLKRDHPQAKPGSSIIIRERIRMAFSFYPGEYVDAEQVDFQRTGEGDVYLTYRITRQLPGFENHRLVEAVLIADTYQGIIVPVKALWDHDGKTGVFVSDAGMVVFYPVRVIYSRGNRAVVNGISPGQPVISRPELVQEGQRLR